MTTANGDTGTDVLRFFLLNEFRVEVGDRQIDDSAWRLRKARSLVKILALTPERRLHREQMMEMLWPEADAPSALRSLNQALFAARQALLTVVDGSTEPGNVIRHHNQILSLLPQTPIWIDADVFEARAREAELTGDDRKFEEAITLYTGDILPEDRYEDWAIDRRNDLRGLYLGMLQDFAHRFESRGEWARAIDALRRSLMAEPAAEEIHAALMRVYALSGRRQQALQQFQLLSEILWREFESTPHPETVNLYNRIVDGRISQPHEVDGRVQPSVNEGMDWIIGREQELSSLTGSVRDGLEGKGRVLLLAGDAGIGKTTLAEAVSASIERTTGALVFWGRCHQDEGVPAYWPWVQILREYLDSHDREVIARDLGRNAGIIEQIVPEVADSLNGITWGSISSGTRFQLFDAVSSTLKRIAERIPVLLVLDDLHWADRSSLLLLDFLLQDLRASPVVVLGCYRESDIDRHHPLHQTLGQLVRQPDSRSIRLSGLSREDAARFMASASGVQPPDNLVSAIHELTEGNPFFVSQIMYLLTQEGDLTSQVGVDGTAIAIPQGVREIMHQRLDRLSDKARLVLDTASAVGREFGVTVVQVVLGMDPGAVVDVLEEAVNASILAEVPGEPGLYRFSHALIRETIYDELGPARRTAIHADIANALEQMVADDVDAHLPELAHHFYRAAPRHDIPRSVDYLTRAGDRSLGQVGFDEAAGYYRRALQILDLATPVDYPRRCSLLLALGDAQRGAGDSAKSRETCMQAATLARRLQLPEHLARAAATVGWASMEIRPYDAQVVELLEEALDALGPVDSIYRVQVLGALVRALDYSGDIDRRARLGDEAVAVARRLNDPETLVHALEGRLKSAIRPENLDQTIADAEEIIRLASVVGDSYMTILGHWWRIDGMLGKGDIAAVDQSIAIGSQVAQERGEPRRIWEALCYQTMRALLSGRYDDAERLAASAVEIGQRPAPRPSWGTYIEHMFIIRREKGRLAELESDLRACVESYGQYPYYHALLTVLLAETGRLNEARESFNWIARQDFRNIPRDLLWLITMALLSELAYLLDDQPRTRLLYDMLKPYSNRTIVPDAIEVCLGSAAHYIGLLAETIGLDDEAHRSYASAIVMNEAMDAAPYLAHSLYAYARWLARTGMPDDTARALEMTSRALVIAQAKQMSSLARRCILLQAEIQKYQIA